MKRVLLLLIGLCMLLLSLSCDLTQDTGEVYFYTIAAEGNGPRSASIRYRSDGYTIIMSCGQIEEEGFDTKEAAEARKNDVSFTLSLEGGPLQPDSGRYVKALSSG